MPKPLLYGLLLIETLALIILGGLFITQSTTATSLPQAESAPVIHLSAREMTVYVKAVGTGERVTDIAGKVYLQDNATGHTEFLFDVGAGCFPTWTLNPQTGYNLLVIDDADIDAESLDSLMRRGALRYAFTTNSDTTISKPFGIRSTTLTYDDQRLRLGQQCS